MRNFILCICFIFIIKNTLSQGVETISALGDSFFFYKKFDIAINEYQRAYFFSEQGCKGQLAEKIANCYLATGEYKLARNYCDTLVFYSNTDSLKNEGVFRKILCYMSENDFGYALFKLNLLIIDSSKYFQQKLDLYKGICYFGLKEYSLAFQYFDNSICPGDSVKLVHLHQLYEKRNNLNRPNPLLAACLSILIPGSGQTYSGNFADGINSVMLLSSLTYIGLYTTPVNIFIVTPFFFRYYIGGILHAKENAENKRNQYNYYYYYYLMNIILNNINNE